LSYDAAVKVVVALVLFVTACDSPSNVVDASASDAAPSARCDPDKPFDAPAGVIGGPGIDVVYRDSWLSADELTIYFERWDRTSSANSGIFVATRPDLVSSWSSPSRVADRVTSPTLTADQLTMYGSSVGTDNDIVVATRSSTTELFGAFTVVSELSTAGSDTAPHLLRDQNTLYVTNADQVIRWKRENGTFIDPMAVSGVEGGVIVSDDELTAYFMYTPTNYAPDRTVWSATRTSVTEGFANRAQVTPNAGSSPSWISADNCVLYLVHDSDPRHGTGPISIFRAVKPL
jgi:hypothetical protein